MYMRGLVAKRISELREELILAIRERNNHASQKGP
jgi:hypothetical protein